MRKLANADAAVRLIKAGFGPLNMRPSTVMPKLPKPPKPAGGLVAATPAAGGMQTKAPSIGKTPGV